MEKADFKKCQICGAELKNLAADSPLYCDKCIAKMEQENENPQQYSEEKELKETLGDNKD